MPPRPSGSRRRYAPTIVRLRESLAESLGGDGPSAGDQIDGGPVEKAVGILVVL